MSSAAELECSKIYLHRCLKAIVFSVLVQFNLLTVYLIFVNFHVLHLLDWIPKTFSLLFSIYTWINIMPLILAVILYGILLGRSYMSVKRYYATRFSWLLGRIVQKTLFLTIHITIGFLTANTYARYLHVDYRSFVYKCYGEDCINAKYVFLMVGGIYASCYHFCKNNLRKEPEVTFPLIQQAPMIRTRNILFSTCYNSLKKSVMPLLCYTFVFWLFGDMVNRRLARLFDAEVDTSLSSFVSLATSLRLLFFSWIIFSQLICSMNLTQEFFSILLSAKIYFPIEKRDTRDKRQTEVTLVEALGMSKMPVIQKLAALYLDSISSVYAVEERVPIFALSKIGNHPHNWNRLYGQCMSMINAFLEELAESVKNISAIKSSPLYCQVNRPIATDAASKMLLFQYNATNGIRRMVFDSASPQNVHPGLSSPSVPSQKISMMVNRINEKVDEYYKRFEHGVRTIFHSIPGIIYMFGEPDDAKTTYILSNSEEIVWIIQALAGICAASLNEDKYGVLQAALPEIIRTFLKLKSELEKLNNVNLNGKKLDRNFVTLRNATKRSIYRITTTFHEYMRDIFIDPLELHSLQGFINNTE